MAQGSRPGNYTSTYCISCLHFSVSKSPSSFIFAIALIFCFPPFSQHAPGIPKVLIGNRLHLAFKRQVDPHEAEDYAEKHNMGFFEVSPLVNFNVSESFVELARMALRRNGMERLWRSSKGKFGSQYPLSKSRYPLSMKCRSPIYFLSNFTISSVLTLIVYILNRIHSAHFSFFLVRALRAYHCEANHRLRN